jgi:hypothetical protein
MKQFIFLAPQSALSKSPEITYGSRSLKKTRIQLSLRYFFGSKNKNMDAVGLMVVIIEPLELDK